MSEIDLFNKFCNERNIRKSTKTGYRVALESYTQYQETRLDELINEALLDEKNNIPLRERRIKNRLLSYRNHLLSSDASTNTVKTYFTKVKTFYRHFMIEIPLLPDVKYDQGYVTNYHDLPTREDIQVIIDSVDVELRSIILFMSSSGTAKAETLSLTVRDFIEGCRDYYNLNLRDLHDILIELSRRDDIVPTFYLRRVKTDKFYYTFCSPEASSEIVKYLRSRPGLSYDDKLFDIKPSTLLTRFQEINDRMGWGFKGKYRFFRTHTLRKYHASNIGLSAEYIDALQGRSKNSIHETYIKTNPIKLKEIYMDHMMNVMINNPGRKEVHQEFTIVVNVFLSGKEYNIY